MYYSHAYSMSKIPTTINGTHNFYKILTLKLFHSIHYTPFILYNTHACVPRIVAIISLVCCFKDMGCGHLWLFWLTVTVTVV